MLEEEEENFQKEFFKCSWKKNQNSILNRKIISNHININPEIYHSEYLFWKKILRIPNSRKENCHFNRNLNVYFRTKPRNKNKNSGFKNSFEFKYKYKFIWMNLYWMKNFVWSFTKHRTASASNRTNKQTNRQLAIGNKNHFQFGVWKVLPQKYKFSVEINFQNSKSE